MAPRQPQKPAQLGNSQLWKLRQDVVLNSLFTRDYVNRYGISPEITQAFFDGYVEYLYEIAEEDGFFETHRNDDCLAVFEKYDSKANLAAYAEGVREWEGA